MPVAAMRSIWKTSKPGSRRIDQVQRLAVADGHMAENRLLTDA
jgi:hypothetical protein